MGKRASLLCNKCGENPKYPAQGLCRKCFFEKVSKKWRDSRSPLAPIPDLPDEKWVELEDAPGYTISNMGRVKSLNYYDEPGRHAILKLRPARKGSYLRADLDKYNIRRYVHRLVAKYFVLNPKPDEYKYVLHKDENKQNNRWDNLKWGTLSINRLDYIAHIGKENLKRRVLKKETVLDVYQSSDTVQAIAIKYNINTSTVWMIKTGYRHSSITGHINTDKRHKSKDAAI